MPLGRSRRRSSPLWAVFTDLLMGVVGIETILQCMLILDRKQALDLADTQMAVVAQAALDNAKALDEERRRRQEEQAARAAEQQKHEAERQATDTEYRNLKSQLAAAEQQTASGKRADSLALELEQAKRKVAALQNGLPVDLVIAIDVSGSMREGIEELKRASVSITDVMSRATSEFNVGVVAYRETVVKTLPLTRIQDSKKAGQASFNKLRNTLESLQAEQGTVDLEMAFQAATRMLDGAPRGVRKQVLLLIGDVGCYELGEQNAREPFEIQLEDKLCRDLKGWAVSLPDRDRRICAFFLKPVGSNSVVFATHSQALFRRFGQTTPNSVYAESQVDMLKAVLEATLAK